MFCLILVHLQDYYPNTIAAKLFACRCFWWHLYLQVFIVHGPTAKIPLSLCDPLLQTSLRPYFIKEIIVQAEQENSDEGDRKEDEAYCCRVLELLAVSHFYRMDYLQAS